MILTRDFNYRSIDWTNLSSPHHEGHPASKCLCTVQDWFLFQIVDYPTRFCGYQTPNLLDLVFSNKPDLVNSVTIDMHIGKNDHVTLNFSLNVKIDEVKPSPSKYNYYGADLQTMNKFISSYNCDVAFENFNVKQCWSHFKSILYEQLNLHISKPKPNTSFKDPPLWMNYVTKMQQKKKKTWRKYKRQKTK